MIRIGPHVLQSRVLLAPMAGVSDKPFRTLCRQFGAALAATEMLSANLQVQNVKGSWLRGSHLDEAAPRSVQIAGSDPAMMAQAARLNVEQGAQIIDINMGCPVKKIMKQAAGSALLRDEALVQQILTAVVQAVDVPVTLKIRTGWSPEQRNGVRIARIAEDAGIQALAVHGRTRCDIQHYLDTGRHLPPMTQSQVHRILRQHVIDLHAFYGSYPGIGFARKHTAWYVADFPGSAEFRRRFNAVETLQEQLDLIDGWFAALAEQEIAA